MGTHIEPSTRTSNHFYQRPLTSIYQYIMTAAAAKKVTKPKPSHPTYNVMIKAALADAGRKGMSLLAISKSIEGSHKVGDRHLLSLKLAMKRALTAGDIENKTGNGLS